MSPAYALPNLQAPPPEPEPDPLPTPDEERAIVEALREQARAEAYAAGLVEGRAELQSAIASLQAAVADLEHRRDALCVAVEPVAYALALSGAEQIVGAALDVRPELILEAARGALRRIVDRDRVTILVNPDDLDRMRSHAADLAEELGGIGSLDVQAERRIAPGGVIVQTPDGDVDARVDTRIERLGDVVREALAPGE
jgi:flagellar assembly protein FliH